MLDLRSQLSAVAETLSDFDAACAARLAEGETLFDARRYQASVYLLGYVVEMRLKLAAFRRLGAQANQPVDVFLPVVRKWMKLNYPHVHPEGSHSLEYWAVFLERHPTAAQKPDAPWRLLRRHVRSQLHLSWMVQMRYRVINIDARRSWAFMNRVWWIDAHWLHL